MIQFEILVKLSPYPVSIEQALFCPGGGEFWESQTPPKIIISDSLKCKAAQIFVLAHELGHAQHYRRGCKCFLYGNEILCEKHAEIFALRFILRYELRAALQWRLRDYKRIMADSNSTGFTIIMQLQQEKIWQKCIDYLETN